MKITKKMLIDMHACQAGLKMFERQFGQETELKTAIEWCITQGIEPMRYANWLIVRVMTRKNYLLYAVFAARRTLHIFETEYPKNKKPREAIEAAEKCIADDTPVNRKVAASYADAAYAYAASYADAAAYAAAYAAYAAAAYAAAAYADAAYAYAASYADAAASYADAAAADAAADAASDAAAYAAAAASYADAAKEKTMAEILAYGLTLVENQTVDCE